MASVTWEDGQLSGDQQAILLLQSQAAVWEGREVGPDEGPYTLTDHLQSPISTGWLLNMLFQPGSIQISGDEPERTESRMGEKP